MELQGTIKKINELETFASGFQKKQFVLLTNETYPQPIAIELFKDKTNLLDNYNVGDSVKVGINIFGKEWSNPQGEVKYFNTITAWRVEKLDNQQVTTQTAEKPIEVDPFADDDSGDLPF